MAGLTGAWEQALKPEFSEPYYRELFQKVQTAYRTETVYPEAKDIFTAFHLTPLDKVKVVILGQDPYHEPGEAHGLAFSVRKGIPIPPSLQNIYKEMESDLGIKPPCHGDLSSWAEQGVLLLNSVLTVRAHAAFSHAGFGWQQFTDAAIRALDREDRPIAFILWGKSAREKKTMIKNPKRLVVESAHPSPLSAYRGFFGSKPFSRVNRFLRENGESEINWCIPDI